LFMALPRVISSVYSSSSPTATPLASVVSNILYLLSRRKR
jgi:hypothetical protein